jgi:hypothetical protein
MGTRIETAAATVERWRTCGWTTIVLEANGDDEWRASQQGVDVTGPGETAALAAADYCRRVEADDE